MVMFRCFLEYLYQEAPSVQCFCIIVLSRVHKNSWYYPHVPCIYESAHHILPPLMQHLSLLSNNVLKRTAKSNYSINNVTVRCTLLPFLHALLCWGNLLAITVCTRSHTHEHCKICMHTCALYFSYMYLINMVLVPCTNLKARTCKMKIGPSKTCMAFQ